MKVIFLDIDGVLNSTTWAAKHGYGGWMDRTEEFTRQNVLWDPDCVERLRRIVEATAAKIVISSTWRENFNHQDFLRMFALYGWQPDIIGATSFKKSLPNPWSMDSDYLGMHGNGPNRDTEIQQWVDKQADELGVTHWVALDDDPSIMHLPSANTVLTNEHYGLEDQDVDKAIKRLGSNGEVLEG